MLPREWLDLIVWTNRTPEIEAWVLDTPNLPGDHKYRWLATGYKRPGWVEYLYGSVAFTWADLERIDPARAARDARYRGAGGRGGPFGWGPVVSGTPIGSPLTAERERELVARDQAFPDDGGGMVDKLKARIDRLKARLREHHIQDVDKDRPEESQAT
jgi:hypothetical protein